MSRSRPRPAPPTERVSFRHFIDRGWRAARLTRTQADPEAETRRHLALGNRKL